MCIPRFYFMFLGVYVLSKSSSCRYFTSMDVTFFEHAPFFTGGVFFQGEYFPIRPLLLEDLSPPPSDPLPLSVPCESAI
ncbi:hypothetical protein GIB67_022304, partial [Kingdonia uniflora]